MRVTIPRLFEKGNFTEHYNVDTYTEPNDSLLAGSNFFFEFLRGFSLFQIRRITLVDLRSILFNAKLGWSSVFICLANVSLHFEGNFRVRDAGEIGWLDCRWKYD